MRNLGKPVELAEQYYKDGADEVCSKFLMDFISCCKMWYMGLRLTVAFQVSFLNITGFRDFPLGDLPMLQVCLL